MQTSSGNNKPGTISSKGWHKGTRETSRFERAMQGMRAKDLAYRSDLQYPMNKCNVRGYGVVASLCSRFMEAERRGFMLKDNSTHQVTRLCDRPEISNKNHGKHIKHQEVTKQLLKQAIEGSDFALLRIIIRMSPCVKDYLNDVDCNGNTLLHRCCKNGDIRLTTVLVEIGLDVNRPGEHKRTPLHLAALHDNITIVSLLLNSCADVFAKDIEGSRPADLCSDPRVRSTLLSKMSTRARSFNTKRNRPNLRRSNVDLNLSRTDSGIMLDHNIVDDNINNKQKLRTPNSPNKLLSSFRDFRFSKESIV